MAPLPDRIAVFPEVCGGRPCVAGTRIPVSIILEYLAAGDPIEEILRQYPTLEPADVRAALAYAAWLAREEDELPLRTDPEP